MKKMVFFLGATLTAISAASADGPSFKDAPVTAAPACAAAQFGGFSVGGYVGAAQHTASVTDLEDYNNGTTYEHDATGFAGGIQLAYDIARCNTLVGFVVDATFMNVGESHLYEEFFRHTSEITWMGTARIRAGVAFDNLYLYATGGIVFADFNNRLRDIDTDDNTTFPVWNGDDSRVGWTVGAGLEYVLSPRWTFITEVLYADFGDNDTTGFVRNFVRGELVNETPYRARFDDEVVVAKVGVNYRLRRQERIEPLK